MRDRLIDWSLGAAIAHLPDFFCYTEAIARWGQKEHEVGGPFHIQRRGVYAARARRSTEVIRIAGIEGVNVLAVLRCRPPPPPPPLPGWLHEGSGSMREARAGLGRAAGLSACGWSI